MVGYDTSYKKGLGLDDGYTLTVYMHWGVDEKPPKNRAEALKRLANTIPNIEKIIEVEL